MMTPLMKHHGGNPEPLSLGPFLENEAAENLEVSMEMYTAYTTQTRIENRKTPYMNEMM